MSQTSRQRRGSDVNHLDLMNLLGRLEGKLEEGFTTLFKRTDRLTDDLGDVRDRLARVEGRLEGAADATPPPPVPVVAPPSAVVAAAPARIKGWQWVPIIAAIVALMGGLANAYQQAERLVIAIVEALRTPPAS